MISEVKSSIGAVLYDRSISPLSGTFIISWIVWNWKLVLIIFGNEKYLNAQAKIFYIHESLSNYDTLIWGPSVSTVMLLAIYPILSIGAYSLWLFYSQKKNIIKNKLEKNQLITVEQSIKLRNELRDLQDQHVGILKTKDDHIQDLSEANKTFKIELQSQKDSSATIEKDLEKAKSTIDELESKVSINENEKSEIEDLKREIKRLNHELENPNVIATAKQKIDKNMSLARFKDLNKNLSMADLEKAYRAHIASRPIGSIK